MLAARFALCVGSAVQSLAEHPVGTVRQLLAEELPLIAGKVGQPCFPCLVRYVSARLVIILLQSGCLDADCHGTKSAVPPDGQHGHWQLI